MAVPQQNRPKPRRPLTETAYAKATDQSRRQVRKAVELGEIRTAIFGGKRLIPASELDRYIETFG